jgi:hypothetical protein
MGAIVSSKMDEAVSCPADVTRKVELVSVEYATAMPAVVRRLDAAIVRPPVVYSGLHCHVFSPRLPWI